MNDEEVTIPKELSRSMLDRFTAYGEIQEDGRSLLAEVTVEIGRFKAVIRPNESQHRGRPHCLIELNETSATFDIVTGDRLAGSLKRWDRTAEKVVKEHSDELMTVWNRTRPDDQKLH